jgi:hypothetical protein
MRRPTTYLDHVGAICCGHVVEVEIPFGGEIERLRRRLPVHCTSHQPPSEPRNTLRNSHRATRTINFVSHHDARDILAVLLQLLEPAAQVLVSQLPCDIERLRGK